MKLLSVSTYFATQILQRKHRTPSPLISYKSFTNETVECLQIATNTFQNACFKNMGSLALKSGGTGHLRARWLSGKMLEY